MIIYLDNILIYIKDASQTQVNAVWWVLKNLKKHGLFANLKKCYFYKDEICFLEYVVSSQEMQMKEKKIEAVKNWSEPKSIQDIPVFLSFANFYQHFI